MSSNVRLTDKNTSDGFLSGFIESSVEMSPDGLNGECIVHYRGEHSNCKLNVRYSTERELTCFLMTLLSFRSYINTMCHC